MVGVAITILFGAFALYDLPIQLFPDIERPLVQLANTQDSNASLLFVFMQLMPGNKRDVASYDSFIRYTVIPRLEAIPGVGSVEFQTPQPELQIIFDPMRAAS